MARKPAKTKGVAPPERQPRLIDVARKAGVSRGIVGHVLNGGAGNSRVSATTAQKIKEVAKAMNYHPNHAARLLRGKRSYTFGLLVASAGDPLRSFLAQYLDIESVKIGCHTFIANTIGDPVVGPDLFEEYVEEFARRGVDGVFCAVHHWFGGDRARLTGKASRTRFFTKTAAWKARRRSPSIARKRRGWQCVIWPPRPAADCFGGDEPFAAHARGAAFGVRKRTSVP